MKPVYINCVACISAQDTLNPDFMANLKTDFFQNIIYAQQPSYKEFIPPAQSRRMSKVVKMSTVSAKYALEEAQLEMPDAIIVGTGMGCTEDSEKFLRNVIQNHEDHLTPTNFIQSTHNTVAGQIALGLGCHAYNFTYVNSGSSLEFSLLDAKLQLENGEAKSVLVGATDETAQRTAELYQLVNIIKKQENMPFDFLNSDTKGVFWGEGSSFFVVENEKKENSYAQIQDIFISNRLELNEISKSAEEFLVKNNLKTSDIDAVILGFSGDAESDVYHKELQNYFAENQQLYTKHLSGEFNTSNGFALFLASHILKNQRIPDIAKINEKEEKPINNLLIYNNFLGKDHSFLLLKKA